MGAADIALIPNSRGFRKPGYAFQPEQKGMPVNAGYDAKREERVLDRVPRKSIRGQLLLRSSQGAAKRTNGVRVIVDLDRQPIARSVQLKIELHINVGKRRNIKVFRHAQSEDGVRARVGCRKKIEFHLAKGVRYLREYGDRGSIAILAKIERDRVEQRSDDARQRHKHDSAARKIGPSLARVGDDSLFQRLAGSGVLVWWSDALRFIRRKVVTLAKRVQVGLIEREEGEGPVKVRQFIEVDREKENAIRKAMRPRCKARMRHVAFVKAGVHLEQTGGLSERTTRGSCERTRKKLGGCANTWAR